MKASVWASRCIFSRSDSARRGPRSRTASPWTVAHVGYSTLGRRAGSRSPASTSSSRAVLRWSNGPGLELPAAGGWCSVAAKAVSNRPGSVWANSRYAWPTAVSRRCAPDRVPRRAHSAHPVGHALSESSHRGVAERRQEGVTVGKMAVGGVGNDPDHARHLAEDNRVRSARARELDASLDKCSTHRATRTRSPAQRQITRPTAGLRITCHHCANYSGQRPQIRL